MSARTHVPVHTENGVYEVVIGPGVLGETGQRVREVSASARCALVTDEHVGALYADGVAESLGSAGFEVSQIVVRPGERSKEWGAAGRVLEELAISGLDRTGLVVALGGGVVGDLAGFCAAVFLRGVEYVQLPTTLLAQVDSSVGGKTGVDLAAGKNLAGAFKQPLLVLADTDALLTLSDDEWSSGLGEVAKTAMLAGADAVADLETHAEPLLAREPVAVRLAVEAAVRHKAAVVAADERESGLRESLNYGHTLGHAIERVAGYGVVPHGAAVAEGMRFAARLARRVAAAPEWVAGRQEALLDALGIGRPDYPRDVAALVEAMHADKKARGGQVRFALLAEPGEFVAVAVRDEVIADELARFFDESDERG